jgi:hypothetical protein
MDLQLIEKCFLDRISGIGWLDRRLPCHWTGSHATTEENVH